MRSNVPSAAPWRIACPREFVLALAVFFFLFTIGLSGLDALTMYILRKYFPSDTSDKDP